LLYLPVSALLFFIGTALYAFYQQQPQLLAGIADAESADAVFPHFIATQLPAGISGLVIAAIMAAAMSSVDSGLNCGATLFLCDIYRRYVRPDAGERESMRVLYGATLVGGIAGTGTGLAMMNAHSVLDVWWQLAGIVSGGLLGLFLLGRLAPRVRGPHAALAV